MPTPAVVDVEAMCARLRLIARGEDAEHNPTWGELLLITAAMLRKQAAEIDRLAAALTIALVSGRKLEAENAELRKDAERWRFLESHGFPTDGSGRDFDMFSLGWQALEEKLAAAIASQATTSEPPQS